LRDGKSIWSLPEESVAFAAVSPDSRLLLTAGQRLVLWELRTGKLLRMFSRKEDRGMYLAIAFSPDGAQFLSGRRDGVVQLWNPRTGEVLRQFVGKGVSNLLVSSVVFLDEGRLAASGHDDGVIRIWDVATGKEIRQLKKLR
jgi:WD40 repeat protein